jgi:hypothetical protein
VVLTAVTAVPASDAAASARLVAYPAVVPATGGRVHLHAYVTPGARACLFYSPLNGQVQEFDVARDCTATVTATLPPNYSTAPEDYHFHVLVSITSTRHITRSVSVVERGRTAARTNPEPTWSGYVATGQTFGIVSGDFTVPTVTCAADATTVSSQWVGIDGWGGPTVEQDGVEMDCNAGSPQYYAWYEMYGDPAVNGGYAVNLSPQSYPVSPGDSITAGVSSPTPNDPNDPHRYTWYLSLYDSTAGWVFSATIAAPSPAPAQDTAEWIVERPDTPGIALLSDFGTASFAGASASSAQSPIGGPISDFPHRALKMTPAKTILATPSPLTDTSTESAFTVTWNAAS